ncbi:hypothetical protein [Paenibacillus aestuarii]|uniref:DUF2264 domain-containing protein n=1 Tax=Paenibacillus aestuarii TaxID=516965 RepID=A0ABW0K3S9_9BACL|nr:hypothetical protein [Paenibacillus aestuarii]
MNSIMNAMQQRKKQVRGQIASQASELPVLDNGYWFESDVRDNFYYASHLFAAAMDDSLPLKFNREEAKAKAELMLARVLDLQDQQPESALYGHWPLNLRPAPHEAPKNTLPVELMGSLMVYFYQRYQADLNELLRASFERALLHIYRSGFYRKPLEHYHHHEAKYTAAKLIFGQLYGDRELLADGADSLRRTYARISQIGMSEYGALPWFWHWVQAFTCAWALAAEGEIKTALAEMLDYLWHVRATYYLQGAWVGPHSRGWPHDVPQDRNVLFDYVQFGDFPLPEEMPRTEYAGFLDYEAPAAARALALNRALPVEVKHRVPRPAALMQSADDVLHSYVYITQHYATGGVLERALEFDNEQHRWDVTLPVSAVQGVNRAFFFHPGQGYRFGDLRHQSDAGEVLFHRNVIAALYDIPADQPDILVGCLPPGEWIEAPHALFGRCGSVYLAVYLQQPYERTVLADRSVVTSRGRLNAVVMECLAISEAGISGIASLQHFAEKMTEKKPALTRSIQGALELTYRTFQNEAIAIMIDEEGNAARFVNDSALLLHDYSFLTHT